MHVRRDTYSSVCTIRYKKICQIVRFLVMVFNNSDYEMFFSGVYLSPVVAFFTTGVTTCYVSWHSSFFIFGKLRELLLQFLYLW
jgi:hypothetical protein